MNNMLTLRDGLATREMDLDMLPLPPSSKRASRALHSAKSGAACGATSALDREAV